MIIKTSDLTFSTSVHNYSTEWLRLPWSFPTGCFPTSLQKCEFKSIGNRKWMCLSGVFGFTSESKRPWPRVEATTTACWQRWAIRTTSSCSKWLFEAFLQLILFKRFCCWCFSETRIPCFNMTKNVQQKYVTNNSTSGHLNMSFSHHQISLLKSGLHIYSGSVLLIAEILHHFI